jgi:hypothetical protein
MTTEQPTDKQPVRLPIVIRAGDLQALAGRVEARTHTDGDLDTAARLARHAAVNWVGGFAAVSLR